MKEEYYCGDCIGTPSCLLSSIYKELCEESDGEECTGILENKAQSLEFIECAVRDLKICTSKLMSSMSDSLKSNYRYIENVIFNCEVAEKLLQSYRTEKKIIDCWDILRSDKRTQMTFYGFECNDEKEYFTSWLTRKEVRTDDTMIYSTPITAIIPRGMGIIYYVFLELLADDGVSSWFPSGYIDWKNYSVPHSFDWISAFRDTDSTLFYPKIEAAEISEDDRRLYEDFIGRRSFTDVTCNENLEKYISDKDYINNKRLNIKLAGITDNRLKTLSTLFRLINEETSFIRRNQVILENQFYSDDKIDWAIDYYNRDKEHCKKADNKFRKYYQTRKPENLIEELSEYLVRDRKYVLKEGNLIGQSMVEEYITKCIALNNEVSKLIIDAINIEKQLIDVNSLSNELSAASKESDNDAPNSISQDIPSDGIEQLISQASKLFKDGKLRPYKRSALVKLLLEREIVTPCTGWKKALYDILENSNEVSLNNDHASFRTSKSKAEDELKNLSQKSINDDLGWSIVDGRFTDYDGTTITGEDLAKFYEQNVELEYKCSLILSKIFKYYS